MILHNMIRDEIYRPLQEGDDGARGSASATSFGSVVGSSLTYSDMWTGSVLSISFTKLRGERRWVECCK